MLTSLANKNSNKTKAGVSAKVTKGVTECTVEVLDVLSDALIDFLEKVGNTISYNVEMSNRPSSHVNILDALEAIELVFQQKNYIMKDSSSFTTWESLAEFAFGSQWYKEGKMREKQEREDGKSLTDTETPKITPEEEQQRWYAPYLDVVPYYPIVQKRGGRIPISLVAEEISTDNQEKLDEKAKEAESKIHAALQAIPDDYYWGAPPSVTPPLGTTNSDVTASGEDHRSNKQLEKAENNIYPWFLPPLPPAFTYKGGLQDTSKSLIEQRDTVLHTTTSTNSHQDEQWINTVRSSLVKMEGEEEDLYWSGPRKRSRIENTPSVPKGWIPTSGTATTSTPQLLLRPSSNRANRILEGSMDATATTS